MMIDKFAEFIYFPLLISQTEVGLHRTQLILIPPVTEIMPEEDPDPLYHKFQ